MSLETGVHTADKLAHFCRVSTGDGHGRGQRAGSLQDRRLRGDDDWRWRRTWNQRLETSKSRAENNHPLQRKRTRMNPCCRCLPARLAWRALTVLRLLEGRRQKWRPLQLRSPAWRGSGPGHWRAAEGWRSGPEDHERAEWALQPLHLERRG